jgi:hypothetical protein
MFCFNFAKPFHNRCEGRPNRFGTSLATYCPRKFTPSWRSEQSLDSLSPFDVFFHSLLFAHVSLSMKGRVFEISTITELPVAPQ